MSTSRPHPLISIVLPVYNGQQYLAESFQSCLNQTLADWELLVVDDASTDNTPAIVAEFAASDGRIRQLRHPSNLRLPAALNTGFAQARGTYLTWTSDDNHYRPEALAEMAKVLENNPTVDFVYTDYDVIDETGRFLRTNIAPSPSSFIKGYDSVPCFLYRRSLYTELGGYADDLFLSEDYEYWLRIYSTQHTMYPLHINLYEYRRHPRSLTDEHRGKTFAASERALLRHLPDLARAGTAVQGEAYLHLASLASWQGHLLQAAEYALRAVKLRPVQLAAQSVRFVIRRTRRLVQMLPRGKTLPSSSTRPR